MNLHLPQSIDASVELETFMSVNDHIVSSQNNAPCIGLVQDGLVASYLLTLNSTFMKKDVMMNCIMPIVMEKRLNFDLLEFSKRASKYYPELFEEDKNGNFIFLDKPIPGKIFYSTLFKPDFSYKLESKTLKSNPIVIIENGIITKESGPLCKKIVGSKSNSIIHVLYNEYSPKTASDFLSFSQFIINRWLPIVGFSVGINDCLLSTHKQVNEAIIKSEFECEEKIKIGSETCEMEINKILNETLDIGMKLTEEGLKGGDLNRFVIMHKSGAKGSHLNISQITSLVGQQNIDNMRPPLSISRGKRCLPYFDMDEKTAPARGFIKNSFLNGMDPQEFFFHAITSRMGLISTASKTQESGYAQRRIVKKLEDYKVTFDGSVRSNNNKILQFLYGGDGYDAAKLMNVKVEGGTEDENKNPFFINPERLSVKINNNNENEIPILLTEEQIESICKVIKIRESKVELIIKANNRVQDKLRKLLKSVKLVPSKFEEFKNTIYTKFNLSLAPGGEMVGIISALSIGEPSTQAILNSTSYFEKVYIRKDNSVIVDFIGKFVDDLLEENKDKVIHFPNEQEYLDLENGYEVTSVDEDGNMHWKKLEAITRHLPGGKLIKVVLEGNRELTATQGLSFLVQRDNKIVEISGKDIKVGDKLPITVNHPKVKNPLKYLDLSKYFSKKEYVYGSEIKKMLNHKDTCGLRYWWKDYTDKLFHVPYKQGDVAMRAVNSVLESKGGFKDGIIYPLHHEECFSELSENIELDRNFGFFMGIYLADGSMNSNRIDITKDEEGTRNEVKKFANKYKIKYSERLNKSDFGTSINTSLYSVILTKLIEKCCGKGSSNKHVPDWAFIANEEFQKGLIDGYLSGDGSVRKKGREIVATSTSKELLEGISLLMSYFGVYSKFSKPKNSKKNNLGTKNIKTIYILSIYGKFTIVFRDNIGLTNDRKKAILDSYQEKMKGERKKKTMNDVLFVKIVSREEVDCPTPKVYDFTVADTKNFCTFQGISVRDTFHFTGISSKDATTGIARLKEILDATESPKTPSCLIFLNNLDNLSKKESLEKIQSLKKHIQSINTSYFYKKNPSVKLISNSSGNSMKGSAVDIYKNEEHVEYEWEKFYKELYESPIVESYKENGGWVIEFEFNVSKLYEFNITLNEIANIISQTDDYSIFCIPSPTILGKLLVYINFEEIRNFAKKEKKEFVDITLITSENMNYYYTREILKNISEKKIGGIDGITKIFPREDFKEKTWIIDTQGSNIQKVLSLPFVDKFKTTCDDFWEVYRVFGIEAARNVLYEELNKCINADGSVINSRHIKILIESMTCEGIITSARREGMGQSGPLAKCAFESIIDNFMNAGIFGESENITSVSSSITLGKMCKMGTGYSEIAPNVNFDFENINNKKVSKIGEVVESHSEGTDRGPEGIESNHKKSSFGESEVRPPLSVNKLNERLQKFKSRKLEFRLKLEEAYF